MYKQQSEFSGVLGVAHTYMIVNICIHFVYLVIVISLVSNLNFNLFKGRGTRFEWVLGFFAG